MSREKQNIATLRKMSHGKNGWVPFSFNHRNQGIKPFGREHAEVRRGLDLLPAMFIRKHHQDFQRAVGDYMSDDGLSMLSLAGSRDQGDYEKIPLDREGKNATGFKNLLKRRRTHRDFSDSEPLKKSQLSEILMCCLGNTGEMKIHLSEKELGELSLKVRSYPSAGGLYPVDVIIVANRVEGLSQGVYQFCPDNNYLLKIFGRKKSRYLYQSVVKTIHSESLASSGCLLFFKAIPLKTFLKYGAMGLRFIFQETGAISQNINLLATEMNLASFEFAAFLREEINELLEMDGINSGIVHALALGNKPD